MSICLETPADHLGRWSHPRAMFSKALALLVVPALALSSQAAPQNTPETVVSLPRFTDCDQQQPLSTAIPLSVFALSLAICDANAHSAEYASLLGTSSYMSLQAELGLHSAEEAIGSATQLTAYVTDINATPVVVVSSKGGQAITMATATGATTTFAGATFVAVPNSGMARAIISNSLLMGAAAVLGSMAVSVSTVF
ncbi:hypothetical protein C8T65DRAFT_631644 [Cerioporus squamosus]|nr:hypothetical protein C8T65DRAFT_631644 [Cerioporus squamosus]